VFFHALIKLILYVDMSYSAVNIQMKKQDKTRGFFLFSLLQYVIRFIEKRGRVDYA
jgi:hypothetical protein